MNDYIITKSDKVDEKLSFSIIFFFIIQSANSTIKSIFPNWGASTDSMLSMISGAVILVMILNSMRYVIKQHSKMVVWSYLLFFVVYAISIVMNISWNMPIEVLLKESMLWTMVWWLPMGLIVYSIRNKEVLYRTLLKWSYVLSFVTLLSLIAYFDSLQLGLTRGNYNMSFSYLLLLPLLIHLNEVFEKMSVKNIIWLIVEVVAILIYGTRAALMCIAVFMFFKIISGGLNPTKRAFIVIFSTVLIMSFFLGAGTLFEDLEKAGYTSRTLEMFTSGTVTSSTGRDELRGYAIELIGERPLFGYGLGGEFAVLFEKAYGLSAQYSNFSSLTPHNGILQLMMNFGVVIGGILSLWLILTIFKINRVKDKNTKTLLFLLCSVYIIPALIVSDGIFIKPGIALYVFLFLNRNYSINNKQYLYE